MTLDVNGIKECLNNLETNVSNFNSICDSIQNNTQEISNACDRLANFNDQIKEELSSYTDESNNEIHHIVRWKITGQDVLKNNIQTLNDSITNAIEITNKIHSKAERLIIKAENAGDKINDLERLTSIYGKDYVLNKLNSNFDTSKLALNIARTSSDAANGNFIAEDKILKDFWTDETLKFEKGENGTYSIWQKDSNGNYQPMGWTDENTKKEYEKLNKQNLIGSGEYYQKDSEGTWKVNYDIATGNVISKDKFNNDSDEEKIYSIAAQNILVGSEIAKKGFDNDQDSDPKIFDEELANEDEIDLNTLDENIQRELINYLKAEKYPEYYSKDQEYSKLSEASKEIIDSGKKIKTYDLEGDLGYLVDNKQDIVVSKGKNLYVNGEKL